MEKFSFQPQLFTEGVLILTDASDTEVDSDIFDELVKTGVRTFKVGYRKQPATDFEISLVEDESQSSVQPIPLVPPNITSFIVRPFLITSFFLFIRFNSYPQKYKKQKEGPRRA
ncbi:hypothetical protein ATANTOWER_023013 [Ataeniobius toweri]|uniref:Uncharacterized protein n=1 Tax=Ataeniobius toweri TaxID=208326 RepID=A0ABU7C9Y0_9TELE|nr:hypothetical protein [Ataeniobius toweri]